MKSNRQHIEFREYASNMLQQYISGTFLCAGNVKYYQPYRC